MQRNELNSFRNSEEQIFFQSARFSKDAKTVQLVLTLGVFVMETEEAFSPSPSVDTPRSLNFDFNLEIEDFSSDAKSPFSSSAKSPMIPIPKTLDVIAGKSVPEFNSICCKVGSTTTSEDLPFPGSFTEGSSSFKCETRYVNS